jgi:hypothetical protein
MNIHNDCKKVFENILQFFFQNDTKNYPEISKDDYKKDLT